jgi:cell division transport system ATP-binding protein
MKRNVPEILAMVGLAGKYKARPNELSGGEQQRVALARALVNKPPILLADEPTGNLDPKNTLEIMKLLERINQNGTTVVVVTHNDKIVNDMQKRVITIKKGVVVSDEEMGVYIDED